ncbi:MAG: phosphoglucosamine mutase, partial [Terriglobia bacterium]
MDTPHQQELFGTDGIRGVAGEPPLDPATIFAVGVCLGHSLSRQAAPRRVILGEDTRESSRWIAETIAAGLLRAEIEIVAAGVITTPGLAFLTVSEGFAAGVMISASHNPYRDNGIKVFASTGLKLPEGEERAITQEIRRMLEQGNGVFPSRLVLEPVPALASRYVDFLRRAAGLSWSLPGLQLAVDCANGSASSMAGAVFSNYGMRVRTLADQPSGRNINWQCGSLHLENLQRAVLETKADLGVALDGDADRALFVAADGSIVNGDGVLWAASRSMKQQGTLTGGAVVGTVMSNLGLELALAREGIGLRRTSVGDKYVWEEMQRSGVNLGGEPSGHIIFRDQATTGDGLLTALQVLRLLAEKQCSLAELVEGLAVFPQTIRNVPVREKTPFESLPQVRDAIEAGEERLGSSGRILVRYSGTEPLARVMVEAVSADDVEQVAAAIAGALEKSLGV